MATYSFEKKLTNPNHSTVQDVEPSEVFENRNQLCLIDVRRSDEFVGELGHAPGAQLITLNTLPENTEKIPKDKTVVFLCRSGGRSGQAAAFFQEQGWTDVYNMRGGMILWNDQGLETEGKNQ